MCAYIKSERPFLQADLKNLRLSPETFGTKFDVIIVDPPWEEYVRRAPHQVGAYSTSRCLCLSHAGQGLGSTSTTANGQLGSSPFIHTGIHTYIYIIIVTPCRLGSVLLCGVVSCRIVALSGG